MNADARLAALRRHMLEEGTRALLVTHIPDVRYITGFEGVLDDDANVACVVTGESARVYTDDRYGEAVQEASSGTPWVVKAPRANLYVELCEEVSAEGLESLTMDSSAPYGRFRFLSEQFRGRVEVLDSWIGHLRQVKEAAEVERIADAAELTDDAMQYAMTLLGPGAVERDVALEIEFYMRRNGAEAVAFPPIVAGGPNSARPHSLPGSRPFKRGDLVVVDIGARVEGYCADLTRTVVIGEASEEQRNMYAAVLDASEQARAHVKSGIRGSDLNDIARNALSDWGLDEHFNHGLGHGVGLQVHELPYVNARGREALPAGAVITIEPGVYVSGIGGVRIEDLVLVEEGGSSVLSKSPRELVEL